MYFLLLGSQFPLFFFPHIDHSRSLVTSTYNQNPLFASITFKLGELQDPLPGPQKSQKRPPMKPDAQKLHRQGILIHRLSQRDSNPVNEKKIVCLIFFPCDSHAAADCTGVCKMANC